MKYQERITITPGKRSGKPCIRDTRITVYDILEYLASGMSEEQFIDEFPELEKDDIRAALLFAADRERKLTTIDARSFFLIRIFHGVGGVWSIRFLTGFLPPDPPSRPATVARRSRSASPPCRSSSTSNELCDKKKRRAN